MAWLTSVAIHDGILALRFRACLWSEDAATGGFEVVTESWSF
jgi:hypothetical protein